MRRKGGGLCHIYGQKQCVLMIEAGYGSFLP